jgi:hypothetical protein
VLHRRSGGEVAQHGEEDAREIRVLLATASVVVSNFQRDGASGCACGLQFWDELKNCGFLQLHLGVLFAEEVGKTR